MSEREGPAPVTFGTLLRAHRLALGLSQEELADRSGLSVRAIADAERGRTARPRRHSVLSLGAALGLDEPQRRQLDRAARGITAGLTQPPATGNESLPVPRQLPASAPGFVGRARELAELTGLADSASDDVAGAVVISAIGGTAGVGKTALAVHFGRQSAGLFPDGQLYVNLAGFGPSASPLAPGQALRGFLEALGVRREQIPQSLDDQAGLYRSMLAGRRMLVVLDNAADEEQVRPLLPGEPGSLAVVTSRRQLTGLAAAEGAALITLDRLLDAEALELLAARLGAARVAAEPGAAGDIVRLCAGLPLALAITAARATARPGWPLGAVAAELADVAGRLDVLDARDPASSARAVFSWSTRQLSAEAAQMFRLLGVHPGPDISVPAAASLAGLAVPQARRLLRELASGCLIAEHAPGRFTVHDLLRVYAVEQGSRADSEPDRAAATCRFLDHYLHSAAGGGLLLSPAREPVTLAAPSPGTAPEQPADRQQAMDWFEAEHRALLAAISLAAERGLDSYAWQIPWAMSFFLQRRGDWQHWATIQRTALAAATRLGDPVAQAVSGRLLASAYAHLGDHDRAVGQLASSLALYQQLGDRLGEAKVQQALGVLAERQGHYADALGHSEQVVFLYQAIGDEAGQAEALSNVGWCHARLGDYQQARAFCREALTLCAETGHRMLEGTVWDSLGYAEHQLGNLAEAAACYQRALSIAREAGDRFHEAEALAHLGDTHEAAGDLARAREAWQRALAILNDLHYPGTKEICAKLASTNGQGSRT